MINKLHCWYGKHDVHRSEFAPNYLKPTYNSGRICRKCARDKAEIQKKKREELRKQQEFYYGMRF